MPDRSKELNPVIGARIRKLRESKSMSQAELGKIVFKGGSTVRMWELGHSEPDTETIKRLATYFNVSTDYILGISDMDDTDLLINGLSDFQIIEDKHPIPLVGRVVAGVPIEAEENLEGYIYVNYTPAEEYFGLVSHGDSMIGAGIIEKSILIVHKQRTAENNDIIIALLNREATVKRFKRVGDQIFLAPANPAYDPILIESDSEFLILGKVVEIRNRL